MMILKPEKLNGQSICKPYTKDGDGMLRPSAVPFVAFPPSVSVVPNVLSYEEMAGKMTDHIMGLKAMKKSELAVLLFQFTNAVAQNERAKMKKELVS